MFIHNLNLYYPLMNRPGVAPQINSSTDSLTDPFPPNLQITVFSQNIRALELKVGRIFTPHHLSHVTFHISCVTCHVSCVNMFSAIYMFLHNAGASFGRVCYQRGLPRLVNF